MPYDDTKTASHDEGRALAFKRQRIFVGYLLDVSRFCLHMTSLLALSRIYLMRV